MADLGHDGNYLVTFVPGGVTDKNNPSLAEIQAGIQMECRITPTGLTREWSTERKDRSKLCSTFSTQGAGRRSVNLQIVFVREIGDTTGLEGALTYKAQGDLIVRDNKPATEPMAVADEVEVYPTECDQPSKAAPAANEDQTVTVGFSMTGEPSLDAVVAA